MTIVTRFFPNGEFTHGVDTSRPRKERAKKECRHEPLTQECRDGYLQWVRSHPDADIHLCVPGQAFEDTEGRLWVYTHEEGGKHYYDCLDPNGTDVLNIQMDYPIGRLIGEGRLSPLVHQSVEFSPSAVESESERSCTPPSRKRLEGMTKSMGRNIRNASYLLEQRYGKDLLSFLTLTLPNLSTDELGLCCERWDYMVDQFLKWLRKRLQKQHIQFEYVYCTEIQPDRLQHRHEYAPHLHILFRGRYAKKYPWAITPTQCRKAWANIISNVVGRGQFVTTALENLQRIRKSASRYLSKYLSKGKCVLPSEGGGIVGQRLRTQWGGMARILSRLIRSCTIRISGAANYGELGVRILRHLPGAVDNGLVSYYKQGEIIIGTCPKTGLERVLKVGVGCLSTPTYAGGLNRLIAYVERMEGERQTSDVVTEMVAGCIPEGRHSILKKCNKDLTNLFRTS